MGVSLDLPLTLFALTFLSLTSSSAYSASSVPGPRFPRFPWGTHPWYVWVQRGLTSLATAVNCTSLCMPPRRRQWHPLQYSCLANPVDGGAWWAAVHGVTERQTRLSDFTFTFHFHALEKEMAAHSSVLAWRIPGMGEPGGLLSLGSHRVGHDWSDLAAAAAAAAAAACWGFSFKIHITISFHLSSLSALQYLSIKRTLGSFMEIYFLYSKPRMLLSFHYLRNSPLLSV